MTAPRWDDPVLDVASDPATRRRRRRLQSWWRHHELRAEPATPPGRDAPVGNLLTKEDVERQPWLNFLTWSAYEHAERRAVEVQKEAGTLDADRLRRNLLSSMPLCFNVFGALANEPGFVELFRSAFDPTAVKIDRVICEWSPRPKSGYLGDNTAFDAAVWYRDQVGRRCLLGIEVKYTEPFSQRVYDTDRYRAVTEECGWFRSGAADRLRVPGSNQLWRNLLLAASMELAGDVDRAGVATLALAGDSGVDKAARLVVPELTSAERLRLVTLESLTDQAAGLSGLTYWATAFRRRYLDDPPSPDQAGRVDPPRGPAPPRRLPGQPEGGK